MRYVQNLYHWCESCKCQYYLSSKVFIWCIPLVVASVVVCMGISFQWEEFHYRLWEWHVPERRQAIPVHCRQHTLLPCALLLLERSSAEDGCCGPGCCSDVCVCHTQLSLLFVLLHVFVIFMFYGVITDTAAVWLDFTSDPVAVSIATRPTRSYSQSSKTTSVALFDAYV